MRALHQAIHPAALAGTFYPAEPEKLAAEVDRLLAAAPPAPTAAIPRALIVPHAAYDYSGPIAAAGYARLAGGRDRIRRVVLVGPSHRAFVHGLALPDAEYLSTPLGLLPVDPAAVQRLELLRQVQVASRAHLREHSIEVQLPFLQRLLPGIRVVPLAVGDATAAEVAEVLELLWDGPETVVIVSSDLSHYLPADAARETDRATAGRILRLADDPVDHDEACGAISVNGLVLAAKHRHLVPTLVALGNSGQGTLAVPALAGEEGDDRPAGSWIAREPVVGYGAFAFYERGA
jgi:AmmeMemoRadiSam system protein B